MLAFLNMICVGVIVYASTFLVVVFAYFWDYYVCPACWKKRRFRIMKFVTVVMHGGLHFGKYDCPMCDYTYLDERGK